MEELEELGMAVVREKEGDCSGLRMGVFWCFVGENGVLRDGGDLGGFWVCSGVCVFALGIASCELCSEFLPPAFCRLVVCGRWLR